MGRVYRTEGKTLALDAMDRIVDIRALHAYDDWRGRAGLKCPLCRYPMHCFRYTAEKPYVRHNDNKDRECWEAVERSGGKNMSKALIRAWLVTYLKDRDLPVQENIQIGNTRATLVTKLNGKPLAIQLHLDKLPEEQLEQAAAEFSKHGFEQLWLMHDRHWLGVQPTASITFDLDSKASVDERLTVKFGLYIQANGGFVRDPAMTLRSFLDDYFEGRLYFDDPQDSRRPVPGKPAGKFLATHDSWHWYRRHKIARLSLANKTLAEKTTQLTAALKAAEAELSRETGRRVSAEKSENAERVRADRLKHENGELKATQQRNQEWITAVTSRRESDRFSRFGLRGIARMPAQPGETEGTPPRSSDPLLALVSAVAIVLATITVFTSTASHLPGWWGPGLLLGAAAIGAASTWWLWRTCWAYEAGTGQICGKKKSSPLPLVVCDMRHHSVTKFSVVGLIGAVTSVVGLVLFISQVLPH